MVPPQLGLKVELGEHHIESYNQLFVLLKHLDHRLFPSKWKLIATGKDSADRLVSANYIPGWMRAKPDKQGVLARTQVKALPEKEFKLDRTDPLARADRDSLSAHVQT